MPEIPDIEVFSHNLRPLYVGKKLVEIKAINGKKLKTTQEALSKAFEGKVLKEINRSGKEFRFVFSNGEVMGIHLMLTGDLRVVEGENEFRSTIVEFHFKDADLLILADRMKNAQVFINPEDKKGVDALSKELNYEYLKKVLKRKANIKAVLTDQNVIRGIGGGYSDEILWEARISPHSRAEAIPEEKIKELAKAIKTVLNTATKTIIKAYPGRITGEVKEFHKVHNKKKTHSPTGYPIKVDEKGMSGTYYTDEQVLYE